MEKSGEDFQIERHGNCLVILPAETIEHLRWDLIESAAQVVLEPMKGMDTPIVVFDLGSVRYFGSVFLSLLLRCHKYVRERGGDLVLCAPSAMARELLSVTALDTLWAIYDTRAEALASVSA
jgi:anti-anti-sigma factor